MPPRRSKRLSAEDRDKGAQGGDDHSPVEKNASSKRKAPHAPSLPRRRSTREKGGSAEAARNALADVNRGPHCPVFQLSHELLKKIWEYLDSKTKMTTTVRTPSVTLAMRSPSVATLPQCVSPRRCLPRPVRLPAVATALLGDGGAQSQICQGKATRHQGCHGSGTPRRSAPSYPLVAKHGRIYR